MILKRENKLNEFLSKNYNILDFLSVYDSINLPFLQFYEIMPKITPRFYTVASSPKLKKNKIEIIISLMEWKAMNNQTRFGLTSSYFKSIYEDLKMNPSHKCTSKLIIRESSFRLPPHHAHPMLMICTGTGIAPFISFCQEFEYHRGNSCLSNISEGNNFNINPSILYFGSKNKNFDFIYEEDIKMYINQDILSKVYTAFSRDKDKKVYVQNIIEENIKEVEKFIIGEGEFKSYIYICGGVSMGAEVVATLEKHFSKETIKQMEMEGRLIKELWG